MSANITVADLQAYVGTDETGAFITSCVTFGNEMVGNYVGDVDTVPSEVMHQAKLICASEIFHRRSAPNGIAQFASMDGSPLRVAKDPMGAVYPLLLPFVGYGI
jgi:hypothetical protein